MGIEPNIKESQPQIPCNFSIVVVFYFVLLKETEILCSPNVKALLCV